MRSYLRLIIEDNTTRKGRLFDYFIQALILVSLVCFALETLPNNSESTQQIFRVIEYTSVLIFTIEYVLRIYVAAKPLRYVLSFYGLIDLLAILPFYVRAAVDLRALRIFRVFRIFRTFKLIRYNRALRRFHIASTILREEILLFFIVTGIFIFLSATGIYYFENQAQPEVFASVIHSLWWSIVTLTTVGYGDAYPITIGGKVFTFFVLIIGVGIVTVPAGLIATSLSKAREIEEEENEKTLR